MAATKSASTLLASAALAAGASVNAAEFNLSTAYRGRVLVKLTNGASAPTTAPIVKFFVGESTGTKRLLYTAAGDTVGASVTDLSCEYSLADMFANVTITNGATNAITVEVFGEAVTGV